MFFGYGPSFGGASAGVSAEGGDASRVHWVLRAEGAAVFLLSVFLYQRLDFSWGVFAALCLVPDLGLLGYLRSPKLGALLYNLMHTYVFPLGLVAAWSITGADSVFLVALTWVAHIGFDRMLGYGLKYGSGFGFTHLGPIGRQKVNKG